MPGTAGSTPEFRMSVLLAREDGSKSSPALCRRNSSKSKSSRIEDVYQNEEKVATESDQVVKLKKNLFLPFRINLNF